jgi:hypothetical protein
MTAKGTLNSAPEGLIATGQDGPAGETCGTTAHEGRDAGGFAWKLAAIVALAFALRMAIRLVIGRERFWIDGYALYLQVAQNLAHGHGYATDHGPTAYRVPLYPLLVWLTTGGVRANAWWLITAQAAMSAATAGLSGLIARRMAGAGAGLIAALAYALWPYGAWHDVSLQESGMFACLSMLATWAVLEVRARGLVRPAGAGLALGLALLTRATLSAYALGVILWLGWRRSALAALAAAAALLLCLSPWLAWQHRVTGTWGLGTETGQSLFAGNHPLTFSVFPIGSIDDSREQVFGSLPGEVRARLDAMPDAERDHWYLERGIEEITAHPAAYAVAGLRKIWLAFGPWPVPRHSLKSDLAYMASWLPFALLGLTGMALRRRHWREDAPLWWHFPTFMAMTALFWAQTSHRSYLDPVIAVYVGVAVAGLAGRVLKKNGLGADA